MPVDASIIAAMRVAVDAAPENVALRLHLGGLFMQSGSFTEALNEAAAVLALQPAHVEALGLAARAAEAAGDAGRAAGYRTLWQALGGQAASAAAPAVSEPRRGGGIPPEEMLPEGETAGLSWDFDLSRLRQTSEGILANEGDKNAPERFENENPGITLKDVAGMEAVKRRLHVAFLGPMQNPQLRAMYGKSLRGGLLLYGPPGCGKTFIARATAGELGAGFISVGLSDVLDMYIGQSERNLHELFEQARRHRPCILFFDEIDALGRKRSLRRESATRDVVNQLLAEMDSVGADNEGVFVLAATNHPWDVDTALRRPGRLDRTLLVLPPDMAAREGIFAGANERPSAGGH